MVSSQKNELDRYLHEPIVSDTEIDSFDVLIWWRDNAPRFPILGKIARDILAIPISTVASESAFSIRGNVVEPDRHALGIDIVQALMYGQDSIESPTKESRRIMKTCNSPKTRLSILSALVG